MNDQDREQLRRIEEKLDRLIKAFSPTCARVSISDGTFSISEDSLHEVEPPVKAVIAADNLKEQRTPEVT